MANLTAVLHGDRLGSKLLQPVALAYGPKLLGTYWSFKQLHVRKEQMRASSVFKDEGGATYLICTHTSLPRLYGTAALYAEEAGNCILYSAQP